MNALEILIAAKAKIENINNWCRIVYATDNKGQSIHYRQPSACKFCARGAIGSVSPLPIISPTDCKLHPDEHKAIRIINEVSFDNYGLISIIAVNEDIGHSAVMNCFDKAIKILERDTA